MNISRATAYLAAYQNPDQFLGENTDPPAPWPEWTWIPPGSPLACLYLATSAIRDEMDRLEGLT